jgi:hypothetical protein
MMGPVIELAAHCFNALVEPFLAPRPTTKSPTVPEDNVARALAAVENSLHSGSDWNGMRVTILRSRWR